MKYKKVFRYVLMIAAVMTAFISCNNDDYKTGADGVSDTVQDGTWKISYFNDSGEDKTQNYSGYNFAFGSNTVITTTKDSNTYTAAIWSVSKSTSDDNISSTIFTINFGSPNVLIPLSRNWKVIENTGTSLKLTDDRNGGSVISQLYFEKN